MEVKKYFHILFLDDEAKYERYVSVYFPYYFIPKTTFDKLRKFLGEKNECSYSYEWVFYGGDYTEDQVNFITSQNDCFSRVGYRAYKGKDEIVTREMILKFIKHFTFKEELNDSYDIDELIENFAEKFNWVSRSFNKYKT